MKLPIQLKYFTVEQGFTQKHLENDVAQPGYEVKDQLGVTVASGTSLAHLFEYALQQDASAELMSQFLARGHLEAMKHLEDVDCDDTGPAGIMVPPGTMPGGAPGGGFLQ